MDEALIRKLFITCNTILLHTLILKYFGIKKHFLAKFVFASQEGCLCNWYDHDFREIHDMCISRSSFNKFISRAYSALSRLTTCSPPPSPFRNGHICKKDAQCAKTNEKYIFRFLVFELWSKFLEYFEK